MPFDARIFDQFGNRMAVARQKPMVRFVYKEFMVQNTQQACRKVKQGQQDDISVLDFQGYLLKVISAPARIDLVLCLIALIVLRFAR